MTPAFANGIDRDAIAAAVAILEAGGLVAMPTETVYGLAADAENPAAVARIYEAKGRPSDHPVIVHLAPGADIAHWARAIPEQARQLIAAFWPGPLTLILKRASNIPDAVSGGQDTIGLRCPAHPVSIALLSVFKNGKGGLAAPSANKFGHVSPTSARHVHEEFAAELESGLVGLVLDGGFSDVGIESTIVDLSRLATHGPVLLRPGHIGADDIAAVIGQAPASPDARVPGAPAPRVSGALDSHYAPRTPVFMQPTDALRETLNRLLNAGRRIALIHYSDELPLSSAGVQLPLDAEAYAHTLYATLRNMDLVGADLILVEQPPQDDAWLGVNDRLRRAAFGSDSIVGKFLDNGSEESERTT